MPVAVPLGLRPDAASATSAPWEWHWQGDFDSAWVRWDELNGWPTDTGDPHNAVGVLDVSAPLAVRHRQWDDDWDNKPIACQIRKAKCMYAHHLRDKGSSIYMGMNWRCRVDSGLISGAPCTNMY